MPNINPIWLVLASFLLALAPILVGLLTSYVKVSIVLGMLRNGIGAQQVPGALVVMALSIALTAFIMAPTIERTSQIAIGMKIEDRTPTVSDIKAIDPLLVPWREFMIKHAGNREIAALKLMRPSLTVGQEHEIGKESLSFGIILPAFVLSELKEAFAMGFVLLLPFLLIDLVVSNVLVGLGMMMVSPTMISLPLKLLLFVGCDGWILLSRGLINSYNV